MRPVLGVVDRQRFGLQCLEPGIGLQRGDGLFVLVLDPFERAVAAGFLQPDEGIVLGFIETDRSMKPIEERIAMFSAFF